MPPAATRISGYVGSTLIPAAGVAAECTLGRLQCGRDSEAEDWAPATATAALKSSAPRSCPATEGQRWESGAAV